MTRHEIRLRGPFDPVPYSALADSCERFFEYLVAVRQSALFHAPAFLRSHMHSHQRDAQSQSRVVADRLRLHLLESRRDAVAAVLCNLYILAGALRSQQKVPAYLPSAAAARQRLLDKMGEVQNEFDSAELDDDDENEAGLGELENTDLARLERIVTKKRRSRWADVYRFSYNEALTGCVSQLEALERYTKMIVGERRFGQHLLGELEDNEL